MHRSELFYSRIWHITRLLQFILYFKSARYNQVKVPDFYVSNFFHRRVLDGNEETACTQVKSGSSRRNHTNLPPGSKFCNGSLAAKPILDFTLRVTNFQFHFGIYLTCWAHRRAIHKQKGENYRTCASLFLLIRAIRSKITRIFVKKTKKLKLNPLFY